MKTPKHVPRSLSIFTLLVGLVAVVTGVGAMMGLSNPTYQALTMENSIVLDNNLRFYGGIWLALGLAALWVAPRLNKEAALFRAIFGAVFIGGIGRVLSMALAGLPPTEFVAYACVEIIVPPVFVYWHYRIIR